MPYFPPQTLIFTTLFPPFRPVRGHLLILMGHQIYYHDFNKQPQGRQLLRVEEARRDELAKEVNLPNPVLSTA